MSHKQPKVATTRAKLEGYASGLEVDTAKDLDERRVNYEYENFRIPWLDSKVRRYTPDFLLLKNFIIVETKGWFKAGDRRKHEEVKKQWPDLDIRFVFNNPNAKLYKGSKTSYADWCDARGFKYSKEKIPQDWVKEKLNKASKATIERIIEENSVK